MQKLVIDTNVFISYLISKNGFSYKIVDDIILNRKALHYVSDATLKDYIDVFGRIRFTRKYPLFSKTGFILLNSLLQLSVHVNSSIVVHQIKDENDNRFLELASASEADYLITGNKLHFTFSKFYNTLIVSPREYWEFYKP